MEKQDTTKGSNIVTYITLVFILVWLIYSFIAYYIEIFPFSHAKIDVKDPKVIEKFRFPHGRFNLKRKPLSDACKKLKEKYTNWKQTPGGETAQQILEEFKSTDCRMEFDCNPTGKDLSGNPTLKPTDTCKDLSGDDILVSDIIESMTDPKHGVIQGINPQGTNTVNKNFTKMKFI